MPRVISGVTGTWFTHGRIVVEDPATGANLANAPLVFRDAANAAVQARDFATEQVVSLITNARGETPAAFLLPVEQAFVSADGGDNWYPIETLELGALGAAAQIASEAAAEIAASVALTRRTSIYNAVTGWAPLDPTYLQERVSVVLDADAPPVKAGDVWLRAES